MIFAYSTHLVLDGSKTQTRRLAKPHESLQYPRNETWNAVIDTRYTTKDGWHRIKWQTGHTYAVQSAQGCKAEGHIRITDIYMEMLQDISEEDVEAEGCKGFMEYSAVPGEYIMEPYRQWMPIEEFADVWDSIYTAPGTTFEDNPRVWVLTFELVEAQS